MVHAVPTVTYGPDGPLLVALLLAGSLVLALLLAALLLTGSLPGGCEAIPALAPAGCDVATGLVLVEVLAVDAAVRPIVAALVVAEPGRAGAATPGTAGVAALSAVDCTRDAPAALNGSSGEREVRDASDDCTARVIELSVCVAVAREPRSEAITMNDATARPMPAATKALTPAAPTDR